MKFPKAFVDKFKDHKGKKIHTVWFLKDSIGTYLDDFTILYFGVGQECSYKDLKKSKHTRPLNKKETKLLEAGNMVDFYKLIGKY